MEQSNTPLETPQVTKEIEALEGMNQMLASDTPNVVAAKIESPTEAVEHKLSDFVADAFKATNRDLAFNEQLKAELVKRLPSLSENQLIALFSNTAVNTNDRISKIIAPTFQLMTATKQAEIQAASKAEQAAANQVIVNTGSPDAGKADEKVSKDVIQGMNALFNLIDAASVVDNPTTNQ